MEWCRLPWWLGFCQSKKNSSKSTGVCVNSWNPNKKGKTCLFQTYLIEKKVLAWKPKINILKRLKVNQNQFLPFSSHFWKANKSISITCQPQGNPRGFTLKPCWKEPSDLEASGLGAVAAATNKSHESYQPMDTVNRVAFKPPLPSGKQT